jgi:hypothetical protein
MTATKHRSSLVLRQDADADLPRQRRMGARETEHPNGRVEEANDSFDPADTRHARSTVRQIK